MFFEKQVSVLKKYCSSYVMYNSLFNTKTDNTIQTECWYEDETVKVFLIDIEEDKAILLKEYKCSEHDFVEKICS